MWNRRTLLLCGAALLALWPPALPGLAAADDPVFLRGDANWDGTVSIADATHIRRFLFLGGDVSVCEDAADANDDGHLNVADAIKVLAVLFTVKSPPTLFPEPYPVPGTDPTTDPLFCAGGPIEPGQATDDLIRVGDVEAAPGDPVSIPIYVTNTTGIQGFQLVIEYDPTVYTPESGDCPGPDCDDVDFSGSAYSALYEELPDFVTVDVHLEGSYFVVASLFAYGDEYEIPPGQDQLLVTLRGTVAADAPVGTTVELNPTNGADGNGVGIHHLRNELTSKGEARYVAFYPRREKGLIRIKDSPLTMDFLRGDVNFDHEVNIADPISTLATLFASGPACACPDAADANDDGTINVADAVATLSYLFATGSQPTLADGFGSCHPDTTPDALGPCGYSGCP